MSFRQLTAIVILFLCASSALSATYTVSKCDDSGAGSLRQAIIDANATAISDLIEFKIDTFDPLYQAGTGTWRIELASNLPDLTRAVVIDGTTQAGYYGNKNPYGPEIELTPKGGGVANTGLTVNSNNCTIKGLVINRFVQDGIKITAAANGTQIKGNYIGVDVSGEVAGYGNGNNGINITDVKNSSSSTVDLKGKFNLLFQIGRAHV
jgi:hypothetical protein